MRRRAAVSVTCRRRRRRAASFSAPRGRRIGPASGSGPPIGRRCTADNNFAVGMGGRGLGAPFGPDRAGRERRSGRFRAPGATRGAVERRRGSLRRGQRSEPCTRCNGRRGRAASGPLLRRQRSEPCTRCAPSPAPGRTTAREDDDPAATPRSAPGRRLRGGRAHRSAPFGRAARGGAARIPRRAARPLSPCRATRGSRRPPPATRVGRSC